MALVLITHDMGVVAETAHRVRGDVRWPDGGGGADRAPVRVRRGTLTPRRCWRRCRSARSTSVVCRQFPASCPASMIVRPVACSIRAAALRRTCALTQPPIVAHGMLERVRCHFPLAERGAMQALMEAQELRRHYRERRRPVHAATRRARGGWRVVHATRGRDVGAWSVNRAAANRRWRAWRRCWSRRRRESC